MLLPHLLMPRLEPHPSHRSVEYDQFINAAWKPAAAEPTAEAEVDTGSQGPPGGGLGEPAVAAAEVAATNTAP